MVTPGQEDSKNIPRILEGSELGFRYSGLVDIRFNFISGFLHRLLCEVDLQYRCELVLTVLKEIVTNCSKAHAKRIYFESLNLDIKNPRDYAHGIAHFHERVLSDWDNFTRKNEDSDYYVEIQFRLSTDELAITIENNTEILPAEWARIDRRRKSADAFKDIFEAFQAFEDESEGAGIGIVFISLLLRNSGIPMKNLDIVSKNGRTHHILRIPRSPGIVLEKTLKQKILSELKALPSLPDRISHLIGMCRDSQSSIGSIALEIQKDPALTAQVLKLVNSASFKSRFKNPDLEDALKILGLEEIATLIQVSASHSILKERYAISELETIWDESQRISLYASILARDRHVPVGDAGVAGLLMDLGKIVLIAMSRLQMEEIEKILDRGKSRNTAILEESFLGISHPEIGALLGEKWQFPPQIVAAIRFQQKPLLCPESFSELVQLTYLAGRFEDFRRSIIEYYSIEPEIMESFGIKSAEQLSARVANLAAYV